MALKSNRRATAPKTEAKKPAKAANKRDTPLQWDKNTDWTWKAINYLTEKPAFCIKLFSNSTSQAKTEGRKKVNNGTRKGLLYQEMALAIFSAPSELKAKYDANSTKYSKSTQQHFARLKERYTGYRKQFKDTGGGVLEGEAYTNLYEKVCEEWEFYKDLQC
ncbi:hypothetical protein H0H93_014447 [Arthromyces matolae]|nr:hypothetical protein H0H93_014447 [Arthromyces matolae]